MGPKPRRPEASSSSAATTPSGKRRPIVRYSSVRNASINSTSQARGQEEDVWKNVRTRRGMDYRDQEPDALSVSAPGHTEADETATQVTETLNTITGVRRIPALTVPLDNLELRASHNSTSKPARGRFFQDFTFLIPGGKHWPKDYPTHVAMEKCEAAGGTIEPDIDDSRADYYITDNTRIPHLIDAIPETSFSRETPDTMIEMPIAWLRDCIQQSFHLDPLAWLESARLRSPEAAVVYDRNIVASLPGINGTERPTLKSGQYPVGGNDEIPTGGPASAQAKIIAQAMEDYVWYDTNGISTKAKFYQWFKNEYGWNCESFCKSNKAHFEKLCPSFAQVSRSTPRVEVNQADSTSTKPPVGTQSTISSHSSRSVSSRDQIGTEEIKMTDDVIDEGTLPEPEAGIDVDPPPYSPVVPGAQDSPILPAHRSPTPTDPSSYLSVVSTPDPYIADGNISPPAPTRDTSLNVLAPLVCGSKSADERLSADVNPQDSSQQDRSALYASLSVEPRTDMAGTTATQIPHSPPLSLPGPPHESIPRPSRMSSSGMALDSLKRKASDAVINQAVRPQPVKVNIPLLASTDEDDRAATLDACASRSMWGSFSLKLKSKSDPIISFEAADALRRQIMSDDVEVFDPGIRYEIVSSYLAVISQADKPGSGLKTLLLPSDDSHLVWQEIVDSGSLPDRSASSVVLAVQPTQQDGSAWCVVVTQKRDLGDVLHGVNIGSTRQSTGELRTMTRKMQEITGLQHDDGMLNDSDVWLDVPSLSPSPSHCDPAILCCVYLDCLYRWISIDQFSHTSGQSWWTSASELITDVARRDVYCNLLKAFQE